MNKKAAWGTAAVLMVAGYGAATWYFGERAHGAYQEAVDELRKLVGPEVLVSQQYTKGFWSSQGQLVLQTRALDLQWAAGRMVLGGQVQLDARAMSSRLSTLRPMGSYRLALAGGQAPTLRLSTLSGALELSGSGRWVGERLRFAGEARAAPGREPALSNLLNIIGRRSGARSLISLG